MFYSQLDIRWKNEKLGLGEGSIGLYGCYLTSLCNGLNQYNYDFTPLSLNKLFRENKLYTGKFDNYIDVSSLKERLPSLFAGFVNYDPWNDVPNLKDLLARDNVILGRVSGVPIGGTNHFVLITGLSGKTTVIHDPWSNVEEKITKRWKNYGNILGLRVFAINPYQEPEKPSETDADWERAINVFRQYRLERKRNGDLAPEGNWESYVRAIVGSDKDIEGVSSALDTKNEEIQHLESLLGNQQTKIYTKPLAKVLIQLADVIEGSSN